MEKQEFKGLDVNWYLKNKLHNRNNPEQKKIKGEEDDAINLSFEYSLIPSYNGKNKNVKVRTRYLNKRYSFVIRDNGSIEFPEKVNKINSIVIHEIFNNHMNSNFVRKYKIEQRNMGNYDDDDYDDC